MDKETLQKLVFRYGSVATALLGLDKAQAQVVYTDVNDTTLATNNALYELNIDGDTAGVVDFRIIQYVDTTQYNASGAFIQSRPGEASQVLGLNYGSYHYPFKLNVRDEIAADTNYKGTGGPSDLGQLALTVNDTTYPNDKFRDTAGVQDGYLGLRFTVSENDTDRTHFGWLRVDVAADLKSITIKDFAYEGQPGEPIRAGEGAPFFDLPEKGAEWSVKFYQAGRTLRVELPEGAKGRHHLRIYDLGGRALRTYAVEGAKWEQSLANLPQGVMVARLEGPQGQRKSIKVVNYR